MHKVLIVDDETIFRKGLRKMIAAWHKDWEVVGEARDGYEALGLLETLRPDVLLTDIRMPKMDGIQLQQIARERFPGLVCIVVSGYDEFSYVQQSLRQGAKDYIMKPIEREELHKVLMEVKHELESKPESEDLNLNQSNEQNRIRQKINETLITNLLRGNVNEKDFELLKRIGIDFNLKYFICLVIKMDKHSIDAERYNQADPSLFQLYIQQFVQEILSKQMKVFSFVLSDTEVIALINLPDQDASIDKLMENAESIRMQIKSLSNITVTIGVGRFSDGIQGISKSYNEAEIALLYRLIVGGDKVLEYERLTEENPVKNEFMKWSWEALEQSINTGNTEETIHRLDYMIRDLCEHARNPETVHQQICKLLIYYYEVTEELGITKQWLKKDIKNVLFDICSISSREELVEACRNLLGQLTECIAAESQQLSKDPIEKSLRYLERHFHEPLTLKEVADVVYLNPAYFSSLFRQKTGKTFIEKLTELRIEEAQKKLLYTDEKIAVIAELTGFVNIRHFNRSFKTAAGVSPKNFRETARSIARKNSD